MRKDKKNVSLLKDVAVGAAVALVITMVLLLIFAILIASGTIPMGMMGGLSVVTLFIGSLIGALVAIKKHGAKALMVGLSEGVLVFLVTLVVGAFWPSESLIGAYTPALVIGALLGGALASLLFARPKKMKL